MNLNLQIVALIKLSVGYDVPHPNNLTQLQPRCSPDVTFRSPKIRMTRNPLSNLKASAILKECRNPRRPKRIVRKQKRQPRTLEPEKVLAAYQCNPSDQREAPSLRRRQPPEHPPYQRTDQNPNPYNAIGQFFDASTDLC